MVTIQDSEYLPRFEDMLKFREYRLKEKEYYDHLKRVHQVDMKGIHIRKVCDFETGQKISCVLLTRGTPFMRRRAVTGQIIAKGNKKHLVGFEIMHESSNRSPMFSFGPGTKLIISEEYEIYWKVRGGDNGKFLHLIGVTRCLI